MQASNAVRNLVNGIPVCIHKLHPQDNADSSSKFQKYGWVKTDSTGDWGEIRLVPISKLNIDKSYQRSIKENAVLAIARDFNWELFNPLNVKERPNGKLYVVDGGHRLEAAKRRGDINMIPCRITQSMGPQFEAELFVNSNEKVGMVKAIDRFRAAVRAGWSPEKDISDWLAAYDLKIDDDNHDVHSVKFPRAIVKTWKDNESLCQEAILLQIQIANGEKLQSHLHNGIFVLLKGGVCVSEYVEKLIVNGGIVGVMHSIRRKQAEMSLGSATPIVCALGILDIINKGKHRKVKMAGGE